MVRDENRSSLGWSAGAWLGLAFAVVAALLAGRTLLEPGFYDSHDGLLNVHRLLQYEKCLADGPTPCRWAPDMGYGYGTPLFVFYPPLSTYVSAWFRVLGASHLDAVKLAMLASFVVGALTMFALAYRFFGASGATLASVLYTWAPYRAVDVFARGAMAEAWGIALVPLVFLVGERVMVSRRRRWAWGLATAIAWAALLLTHNLTTLIIAPAYALWCGLWLVVGARSGVARTWTSLAPFAASHLLALCLAAYYVVPSLLEQQHAHIGTLSTLYAWARYENNFITVSELLFGSTPWGYGAFRQPGGISLFIGTVHWVLAAGSGVGIAASFAYRLARGGDPGNASRVASRAAALLLLAGIGGALMTVPYSRIVWSAFPQLAFLQFPWRFLTLAIFGFSFGAAWWVSRIEHPRWIARVCVLCVAAVAIGASYGRFAPSKMIRVENDVLANAREVARMRHGLFDFLPSSVDLAAVPRRAPAHPPKPVETLDPALELREVGRTSHRIAFEAVVESAAPAMARFNVFRFPGWTLRIDDVPTAEARVTDPLGRIHVDVPPGKHRVSLTFEPTRVRAVADAVSAAAAFVALLWGGALLRAARYRAS